MTWYEIDIYIQDYVNNQKTRQLNEREMLITQAWMTGSLVARACFDGKNYPSLNELLNNKKDNVIDINDEDRIFASLERRAKLYDIQQNLQLPE